MADLVFDKCLFINGRMEWYSIKSAVNLLSTGKVKLSGVHEEQNHQGEIVRSGTPYFYLTDEALVGLRLSAKTSMKR